MSEQTQEQQRPIITIGPGFFIPASIQFSRDCAPALTLNREAQRVVNVDFQPLVVAYPGDRVGLHLALDRWLDEGGR